MSYKLLISMDVVEFVERMPLRYRKAVRASFTLICADPVGCSDCTEYDSVGRLVHIAIVGEFALTYWIDDADHHVKILDIHSSDR